jgi:hypothetical protein
MPIDNHGGQELTHPAQIMTPIGKIPMVIMVTQDAHQSS